MGTFKKDATIGEVIDIVHWLRAYCTDDFEASIWNNSYAFERTIQPNASTVEMRLMCLSRKEVLRLTIDFFSDNDAALCFLKWA